MAGLVYVLMVVTWEKNILRSFVHTSIIVRQTLNNYRAPASLIVRFYGLIFLIVPFDDNQNSSFKKY